MTRATTTSRTNTNAKSRTVKKVSKPTSGVIAVDNGGEYTKIFAENMKEPVIYSAKKGYGHTRLKSKNNYDAETFKIVHNDTVYFTGKLLLEADGELPSYTESKATNYFLLSILHAVALHGFDENYLVTCTPFNKWDEDEIEAITEMVVGDHEITINDVDYKFSIKDVFVLSEVTPAFFIDAPMGKVHWLEFGSRTVGYATTVDGDLIEGLSGTLRKMGLDIKQVTNFKAYVSQVARDLLKVWDEEDEVRAFGGGIEHYEEIAEELRLYFPNLVVIEEDPQTIQVRGMLEAGIQEFSNSDDEEYSFDEE